MKLAIKRKVAGRHKNHAKPALLIATGLLADPREAYLINTSQLGTCSFFPNSYSARVSLYALLVMMSNSLAFSSRMRP